MSINILYFMKFPFKIHSFEEESQNVTNNFSLCKNDIQGKNYKVKNVAKLLTNILYLELK